MGYADSTHAPSSSTSRASHTILEALAAIVVGCALWMGGDLEQVILRHQRQVRRVQACIRVAVVELTREVERTP